MEDLNLLGRNYGHLFAAPKITGTALANKGNDAAWYVENRNPNKSKAIIIAGVPKPEITSLKLPKKRP